MPGAVGEEGDETGSEHVERDGDRDAEQDGPHHRVADDLPQQIAAPRAVEHADQRHQAGSDRDLAAG